MKTSGQSVRRAVYALGAIGLAVAMRDLIGAETGLLSAVAAAFFLSDALQLRLPRGGKLALNGGVATVAIAMLDPFAAVGGVFVGVLIAAAVSEPSPSATDITIGLLRRGLALAVGIGVFRLTFWAMQLASIGRLPSELFVVLAGCAYMAIDLSVFGAAEAARSGRPIAQSIRSLFALVGGVYLSQVFVGAATVVVYSSLGLLAFGILFVLMLLLQSSFTMLLRVRTAYTRTLSALARLAECQMEHEPGHSERVAEIATAVARVRRVRSRDIEMLSHAALLHSVGDLHGAQDSCVVGWVDRPRLPHELFEDIPYLAGVGPVISASLIPFDRLENRESHFEMLGGILRLACAYDAMASRSSLAVANVMDALRSPGYDPVSLGALQHAIARGETGTTP